MFNPTATLASSFGNHLADTFLDYFSGRHPEYAAYINGSAKMILERLANSDALYHNAEHTIMVTLVGQQIMRGRLVKEAVQPEDWLHYILALLVHDVGYLRDICDGDSKDAVVVDTQGNMVRPPKGASDAYLAPYHVDRGMMYARARFKGSAIVDEERIARAVDFTRFPVPTDDYYQATDGEPALVRAADLIGQMADPFYHRKIGALYLEFQETGMADKLGYKSAVDLMEKFPDFFWSQVQPLIGPALVHLEQTMEGKQWVAQLYNHLFQVDHKTSMLGPFGGTDG